jgi:DNA-binding FadR family transcriptional regulator
MRRATAGGKARKGAPRDEFDQLLDVRRVVEVAVAERAAQFATAEELRDLEMAIAAMREQPDDAVACAEADLFFHRVLARSAGNALWPAILGGLNDSLRRLQQTGHHGRENALQTADEHEAIRKAIAARDAEGAAAAMRAHLETSGKDLLMARRKKKA